MQRIRTVWTKVFSKYPILTNSVIYGSLYVGAEFSQQLITRKVLTDNPTDIDKGLLVRYGIMGSCGYGPVLSLWYRWLDKHFVGTTSKIIFQKLMLDQFLMTPQLLVMFFVGMSIMEMKKDVFEELKQKMVPTFKTSCMFWLPAQCINFMIIPPAYRVIYVGSCSFAWCNILCIIKRQNIDESKS